MEIRKGLNFCDVIPLELEGPPAEYRDCNFACSNAKRRGGEDTAPEGHRMGCPPGTRFVNCNLVNRELPEGVEVIRCNQHIRDALVPIGEVGIVIDGEEFKGKKYVDLIYGRYVEGGLIWYRPEPLAMPVMNPEDVEP